MNINTGDKVKGYKGDAIIFGAWVVAVEGDVATIEVFHGHRSLTGRTIEIPVSWLTKVA